MTEAFLTVVKLSASASVLAGAVLVARLLLRKAPKWSHVLLWAMVAVRLVLPVSIESQFSRMPEPVASGEYLSQWDAPEKSTTAGLTIVEALPSDASPSEPVKQNNSPIPILSGIWCAGMAVMALYTLLSWLGLKRQVQDAFILRDNVYRSNSIDSPFVLGIVKPRIYLPSRLDGDAMQHVLAHEHAHIRRGDHLWKPLGFFLLTIHWFNPLLWLCYILLCRDIELACDERAVRSMDRQQRADYSQALLQCSIRSHTIAACPLAFGEVGVRQRVKNVLSYKKPGFWIVLLALVLCIVVAVSFLTDPVNETTLMEDVLDQNGYYILSQESKTINLVIEKDSLDKESFTEKGCHYSPGVLVPYHTFSDNLLYVSHVCQKDGWLEITFDFTSGKYQKGKILSPWSVDLPTGYLSIPARADEPIDVWDNQTTYPDAATLEQYRNQRSFTVRVKSSVYEQAGHHIAFALTGFTEITYTEGERPPELAIETQPKVTMAEFFMFAKEVNAYGLTIQYQPDGAFQNVDAVTDLNYWLEQKVNGQWQRIEPHSQEGLPIEERTIHTILDTDTDRHLLNWSTLYGTLPSGEYRIGIDYYFREEGTAKTCYADFTIEDGMNPAAFTSTMTTEGRWCSAEFPPNTEAYVFTQNQTAHLISILNRLKPEDFFTGAAANCKVMVSVSHSTSPVQLFYDGHLVQFSFVFDNNRWAVRNDELNAFMESLLKEAPENITYDPANAVPLNELPASYTMEDAETDKVVVLLDGDIKRNSDVWETFLLSCNSRIPTMVRIMKVYSSANGLDDQQNLYDVEFDGNSYYLHYVQNGTIKSAHYHNLCRRSGQATIDDDNYEEYAFYFLTNSDTIDPTQKVRENDRSTVPGADPFMIWCEVSQRAKYLSIPDSSKITLEVDLRPIVTITDPGVIDAIELIFSEAYGCTAPADYFPGPVLRFHSPDGLDLSLMLDLQTDHCIFNNQFYYYGKPGHSILQGLWKLMDLDYWPHEIVEHDKFARYFDQSSGSEDSRIIGTWLPGKPVTESALALDGIAELTFHQNNAGQLLPYSEMEVPSISFSYQLNGNSLSMRFGGGSTWNLTFRFDGNKLIFTNNGQDVTYVRKSN